MAVREHYATSVAGPVTNNNSASWVNAATWTFPGVNGRDYIVFWSLTISNTTSPFDDSKFRIRSNGTDKVVGNYEQRNTGEDNAFGGFYKVTGDGSDHSITVDIQPEYNTDVIRIANIRLVALAMGPNDLYAETTGRTDVNVGSTSYADLVSVTVSPSDDTDYLVMGCSMVDNFVATAPAWGRVVGSGNGPEFPQTVPEVGAGMNKVPLMGQFMDWAGGGTSVTMKWQGRSLNGGNNSGWTNNRILALSLNDFPFWYVAGPYDDVIVSSSTPVLVAEITPEYIDGRLSGGNLFLTSVFSTGSTVVNVNGVVRILEDSTVLVNSVRRSYSTANNRGLTGNFTTVLSGSGTDPNDRTWKMDVASVGTNPYRTKWGTFFTLIDLGVDDAPPGDAVGAADGSSTVAATGQAVKASVASGVGVGVAAAAGLALAAAVGSAAGVSTVDATARAVKASVGTSANAGTAAAVGVGVKAAVGAAPAVGAATAQGASTAASVGASTGLGAASGASLKVVSAVGTASGVGSATATGASTSPGTYGTASGTATAAATGGASAASTGVAGGYVAVDGRGASVAASVGAADGTSIAQGAAVAVKIGVATGSGQSGGQAQGASTASSVGTGYGQATVAGAGEIGNVIVESVGTANSVGLAAATGRAILTFVGVSGGTSVVSGVSLKFTTPVDRTLAIPQDFRVMRVSFELRTMKVSADRRSIKVLANNRMV